MEGTLTLSEWCVKVCLQVCEVTSHTFTELSADPLACSSILGNVCMYVCMYVSFLASSCL